MWAFIIAGAIYLIGVAAVLVLRPSFMFTPDGNWKEFGIGKREDRYTPFPFWLFCLTWALIAYVCVILIMPSEGVPSAAENRNSREYINASIGEPVELPKGYYVLNKKATKLSGVPKYVYLGPEEPSA